MELGNTLKNENTLDNLLGELPDFCRDFFIGTSTINTQRTQIRYAYNLKLFFTYLKEELDIKEITLDVMNNLVPKDIENYLFYTT